MVEGHFVGRIDGFKFVPDTTDSEVAGRTVAAAAFRALAGEVGRRASVLISSADETIELRGDGLLAWQEQPVARLTAGADALKPIVKLISSDLLDGTIRDKIESRLQGWLDDYIAQNLKPLLKARDRNLIGAVRGLVFQLVECGGVLNKRQAAKQLKALEKKDYGALHHLGIKLGRREIFFPPLLRPKPAGLSALLWAIKNDIKPLPEVPPPGRVSVPYDTNVPFDFMQAAGFRQAGNLFVRIDILERLLGMLKSRAVKGPFAAEAELLNLLGCSAEDAVGVFKSLGFEKLTASEKYAEGEEIVLFAPNSATKKKHNRKNKKLGRTKGAQANSSAKPPPEESPFAKLKELKVS